MDGISFPGSKRFAFTIIDDTDCATVENIKPIYELLHRLGFRTTKTVWTLPGHHPKDPDWFSQALADPDYLSLIRQLQEWGFEIALHNTRSFSCTREETRAGLEAFHTSLGRYPRVQANHMFNREDLYWGAARFDRRPVRLLYSGLRRLRKLPVVSEGHCPDSPFFWGDLCQQHIEYVRGFTFPVVNVLRVNPTLPYYDPKRPYVRSWFSACDATDVRAFNRLLRARNMERLEREGGICIVATHLAADFVLEGRLKAETEFLLTELAQRPGWFVPVSELLDFLVGHFGVRILPAQERTRMEWYWLMWRIPALRSF